MKVGIRSEPEGRSSAKPGHGLSRKEKRKKKKDEVKKSRQQHQADKHRQSAPTAPRTPAPAPASTATGKRKRDFGAETPEDARPAKKQKVAHATEKAQTKSSLKGKTAESVARLPDGRGLPSMEELEKEEAQLAKKLGLRGGKKMKMSRQEQYYMQGMSDDEAVSSAELDQFDGVVGSASESGSDAAPTELGSTLGPSVSKGKATTAPSGSGRAPATDKVAARAAARAVAEIESEIEDDEELDGWGGSDSDEESVAIEMEGPEVGEEDGGSDVNDSDSMDAAEGVEDMGRGAEDSEDSDEDEALRAAAAELSDDDADLFRSPAEQAEADRRDAELRAAFHAGRGRAAESEDDEDGHAEGEERDDEDEDDDDEEEDGMGPAARKHESEEDVYGDEGSSDGDPDEGSQAAADRESNEDSIDEAAAAARASDAKLRREKLAAGLYGGAEDRGDGKAAGAASKYVPPHMRKAEGDASTLALTRQIRGLLNKLSGDNIASIAQGLAGVFQSNNILAASDVFAGLVAKSHEENARVLDRFSATVVAVVAALHRALGMDVGASVLDALVRRLEDDYAAGRNLACANWVQLLSHLYNFRVVSSALVFDYVRRFVRTLGELDVELLLVLLTACGQQLRSDDPAALRDIVVDVQAQTKGQEAGGTLSTRTQYMLTVIYDLKNNRRGKAEDEQAQMLAPLLKAARAASGSKGSGEESQIRVPLVDLLNKTKRGRWWAVSSAFAGRDGDASYKLPVASAGADDEIMGLARKQRMNTDVRRAIFAVIMSADDYLDAFEKLVKLNLKNKQDRQIVYVLIDCCVQEQKYNPYYYFLGKKLCSFDHNYKFTFQYSLWDRFKALGSLDARGLLNLAQLLASLIGDHVISLAILKAVEFDQLDRKGVLFFRLFFSHLFHSTPEDTVRAVFARVGTIQDLVFLREALAIFLNKHFLGKDAVVPTVAKEADAQAAERKIMRRQAKVARAAIEDGGVGVGAL